MCFKFSLSDEYISYCYFIVHLACANNVIVLFNTVVNEKSYNGGVLSVYIFYVLIKVQLKMVASKVKKEEEEMMTMKRLVIMNE